MLIKKLLVAILIFQMSLLGGLKLSAQCGFGGINYGDVTPAGVGSTVVLTNVWGGDQYSLQATAGCTYQISMCGTSWDTQITVFNPSQVVVAYNDDSCGLASVVTFTAATTGSYTIQVNQYNCTWNFTNAQYFGVTLLSCLPAGGCNDPVACNYALGDTDNLNCCYDECLTIIAGGGTFDNEISWEVLDGATIVASGIANEPGGVTLCLPEGCYVVNLYDSFGDGWNGANFVLLNDGNHVFNTTMGSGNFLSAPFCTEYIPPCFSSDPTGCPAIDLGADISLPICDDPCSSTIQVTADVFESGETTSYEVCSIAFAPPFPFNGGTGFSIGTDDVWSNVVNLPFDFCFFGNNYSQMVVGSNGLVSFDVAQANLYCNWSFNAPCPNPALPLNSVFGVYHDIDPSICGGANYSILGTAPCRVFVVNYNDICQFSCTSIRSTSQIVFYETTNVIEVYVQNKPTCTGWNNGNALIGIQNATGLTGFVPSGRQTGPWSANNEAWRFTPNGPANFAVNWYDQTGFLGSGLSLDICPVDGTHTYIAEAVYTKCDGTNITVSDDVVVACATIMLPVEWLDFTAKLSDDESVVMCDWLTASELNNSHFIVQRSIDTASWEDVGVVPGAGTTNQEQAYQLIDHRPYSGTSYYRVVQVDFNGKSDVSQIRSVVRSEAEIYVYPNPGNDIFHLSASNVNMVVFDALGREIAVDWLNSAEFRLSNPAQGCYFVEFFREGVILGRQRLVFN
ncbi:MAG: T9SS type A sorting domain-containing protein [Cryomorphaceae bacterium]|nr:T9SS type A sorting domain-containing protein [Cryomorphaceae bacterium]